MTVLQNVYVYLQFLLKYLIVQYIRKYCLTSHVSLCKYYIKQSEKA